MWSMNQSVGKESFDEIAMHDSGGNRMKIGRCTEDEKECVDGLRLSQVLPFGEGCVRTLLLSLRWHH